MLPACSHRTIAALTGVDRDGDFIEAEREEPACVMAIAASDSANAPWDDGRRLADAVQAGRWSGRASQLSEDHVAWTFIDEIARGGYTRVPVYRDSLDDVVGILHIVDLLTPIAAGGSVDAAALARDASTAQITQGGTRRLSRLVQGC
jgi:hypothetical protein